MMLKRRKTGDYGSVTPLNKTIETRYYLEGGGCAYFLITN